jgi:septal ring factor EnvC (AmiA/AmiB activator)
MTEAARIAELEAENAALRAQVEALAAQVQMLQGRLAKDSHNSSNPPSSDGLARKTKTRSLRHKRGRKPGATGPLWADGATGGDARRLVGCGVHALQGTPITVISTRTGAFGSSLAMPSANALAR